jgi:phosphatidylserine/phosphatidylglycerophosphate/cardiolipin synthase-like enzyme
MKHLSSAAIRLSRLLVALALLASALACEDLGTPQPGGPTTRPPDNPNWYHLYFTGPTPDNPTGGIPDEIVASLDAAQKTIDVAIYEFNLPVIADALLQAKARGVRVRLVTDTDLMEEPVYQDLRKGGLQVVAGQPNAIMHNKFVVIDGATLWTGSMNFTENEASRSSRPCWPRTTRVSSRKCLSGANLAGAPPPTPRIPA